MHLDQVMNLFRIDGTEESIIEHVDFVRKQWSEIDSHVTVEILGEQESRILESRFIFRGCVLWEEAKERLPTFEYTLVWN